MKRRLSTRARLERLEKALKNGAPSHGQAIVEMCDWNDGLQRRAARREESPSRLERREAKTTASQRSIPQMTK